MNNCSQGFYFLSLLWRKDLFLEDNFSIIKKVDLDSGADELSIRVDGPLSTQDGRKALKFVEMHFKIAYPWLFKKYKPYQNIDRDIKVLRLTKKKKDGSEEFRTDLLIASAIFEDSEDISHQADRRRRSTVWSARKRLKDSIKKRFPPDTFVTR